MHPEAPFRDIDVMVLYDRGMEKAPSSFQFYTKGWSQATKYDWDKLLDGNRWRMSPMEMHRDMKLRTQMVDDDKYIVIQARSVG